jgi:hypothetical protein
MGQGERVLEKASASMASLAHELQKCTQCYSVLLEWKQLHDLLQDLEVRFTLISERIRGKSPSDIQPHLLEMEQIWRLCGDTISNKLVPFAQGIKHSGERYEERNGQCVGEEWIVKIVQAKRDIDEDLQQLALAPLHDHLGNLDSLITKHLFRADTKLQATKATLSDSCHRLSMIVADEPLEDELAVELIQFIRFQQRLIEWMELHELFQKLRTYYTNIYSIVSQKHPTQLDAPTLELIRQGWRVFENTVFWELVAFAKAISHIGEAYQEQEQSLCGEEWVVKLVQLREAINQALKKLSLAPLHESLMELGGSIRRYFIKVDDELKKCAEELDRSSIKLQGRVRL